MKKILVIVLSLSGCKYVAAAMLSCNAWLADSVVGEAIHGNDIVLSAVGTSGTVLVEHSVEITMPHLMSEILDGREITWHLLSDDNTVTVREAGRITAGTTYYSDVLLHPAGPVRIELRTPTSVLPPKVTPASTVRAEIRHQYRLSSGQITSASSPTFYITSTNETIDSIILPDRLDLGPMTLGYNMSDELVQYSANINSIPLKFNATSTPNSFMTVNNQVMLETKEYTPPLRIGMLLQNNAELGIYTSTVNATWTCP